MPGSTSPRRLAMVLLAAGVAMTVAGCGDGTPTISVTDAFVPVPASADTGSVYLTITNSGDADDVLTGVSTPVAPSTHLHETEIEANGRTTMTAIGTVSIPAGTTVELGPGGLHLMMMQPKVPAVGEQVELSLTFRTSGVKRVTATVTDDIADVVGE